MNKKQIKEFEKRYDKFKNNNLPTPFWDEERQTHEFVYFDDEKLIINNSIYEALGDLALTGFYYPFNSGYLTGSKETDYKLEYTTGHNHAHSFEEVVNWLYDYPESFSISKDEEEFYSRQELEYLRDVKEFLLFIGLKDCKSTKRPKSRFKNKKYDLYKNSFLRTFDAEIIEKILSGQKNTIIHPTEYPELYPDSETYDDKKKTELLRDKNGKIRAFIEYTRSEKKQYKDIKNKYPKDGIKDNDYVIINHIKVLKKY